MEISISKVTEVYLVKTINSLQTPVVCLDITGGPCYLVAPKIKKIKETKKKHSYPCFKVSGVDTRALNWALSYYGYEVI